MRWVENALKCAQEDLTIRSTKAEPKRGPLEAALARIAQHTPKETYKSGEKLTEAIAALPSPEQFDYVESAVGECPQLGIGNVPEDEAVMYAVGDADHTLRDALWMDAKRTRLKKEWAIAPGDGDANIT